ncbi:SUR7/PalI family-domain-containing protein [Gautieria morchelliformis]|nr:SUR7/PalI family-domain-containing protein [Gautieria morchelliformis]
MSIIRPATPGFLVTLTATILLAVVSFSVPYIQSVYFLKATVDLNGQHGVATFGVLGYCLNTGGSANCTTPKLGYEFDPNTLLGNTTPIKIPQIVVKWLTYALVLHIVALVFAAGSALFGLLAHVREMSMACCSTCISGFGAAVALIAFIFDIAFFFLLKARIGKIQGGSAQTGNAIWLTLAAMLLMFFAGCFYGFGRCCISNRPRGPRDKGDRSMPGDYEAGREEAMRLDAVKAEADRKARQKQGEVGLPAFQEYDPTKPLTAKYDEEDEPYQDHQARQASGYSNVQASGGGYVPNHGYAPAAPGTSAMEAYYAPPQAPPAVAGYPPQQATAYAQYPPTQYNAYDAANAQPSHNQYLSSETYGHGQYASNEGTHGLPVQDTSYYAPPGGSAPYPSSTTPNPQVESAQSYFTPPTNITGSAAPFSMGRDDYSFSSTPPAQPVAASSIPARQSPGPHGPRSPTSPTLYSQPMHSDNPPGYEAGHTAWLAEKR